MKVWYYISYTYIWHFNLDNAVKKKMKLYFRSNIQNKKELLKNYGKNSQRNYQKNFKCHWKEIHSVITEGNSENNKEGIVEYIFKEVWSWFTESSPNELPKRRVRRSQGQRRHRFHAGRSIRRWRRHDRREVFLTFFVICYYPNIYT